MCDRFVVRKGVRKKKKKKKKDQEEGYFAVCIWPLTMVTSVSLFPVLTICT